MTITPFLLIISQLTTRQPKIKYTPGSKKAADRVVWSSNPGAELKKKRGGYIYFFLKGIMTDRTSIGVDLGRRPNQIHTRKQKGG